MKSKEMEEQIEIKVRPGPRGRGRDPRPWGLPSYLQSWPLEGGPAQCTGGSGRPWQTAARSDDPSSAHLPLPSPARPAWERLPQPACSHHW